MARHKLRTRQHTGLENGTVLARQSLQIEAARDGYARVSLDAATSWQFVRPIGESVRPRLSCSIRVSEGDCVLAKRGHIRHGAAPVQMGMGVTQKWFSPRPSSSRPVRPARISGFARSHNHHAKGRLTSSVTHTPRSIGLETRRITRRLPPRRHRAVNLASAEVRQPRRRAENEVPR